jgi:hypothetical protein
LVNGGYEWVEGKLFKQDGTTPFAAQALTITATGNTDFLWQTNTDGNGIFGVMAGATAFGQNIGTIWADFPYFAGNDPIPRSASATLTIEGVHPTLIADKQGPFNLRSDDPATTKVNITVKDNASGRAVYAYSLHSATPGGNSYGWRVNGATDLDGKTSFEVWAVATSAGQELFQLTDSADNSVLMGWFITSTEVI